jgi:hypothetical protein
MPVRRLLLIMLAALAVPGVAFALRAMGTPAKQARFTLVVTPARQSAVRGGAASFSVRVVRSGGFAGATALRVAGLPRGVRAHWRLADGTRSRVVPPAETGAKLTLRPSARAPLGPRPVKVLAAGGGTTHTRRLTLTVRRRRWLRFSLRVHPRRQVVSQGASATYDVRVTRAAGFRRGVRLRVLRLPRAARATWKRTALTVATGAGPPLGSHRLVVKGTSRVGGRRVRRYAVAMLTVVEARQFQIGGDLATPLYPGGGAPLDLVLSNPHDFDLRVTALSVQMRAGTTNPGCESDANYAVTQYSGGYPLVLHPGSTRLSALVSNSSVWPQVSMHDLPTNQDACKDARLSLDYEGLATR